MTGHRIDRQRAAFQVIAKPAGPRCNLACTYCFYLSKGRFYPDTWRMSDDVVETFVRQYLESQDIPAVSFSWQGGEPTLLGVPFFERVVELQRRYAGGRTIENALQTNGVLLDDEWGAFLAREKFLVGLSIDGPRHQHDRYRVDRGGAPTFDRVMRGLDALQRHNVEFNTLTVVQRDNACRPLEVYRFLKSIGSRFHQYIPIVERVERDADGVETLSAPDSRSPAPVTPWSVDPGQYGRFLCAIFDEWVRHDVGRTFVQLFDVSLGIWALGHSSLCAFQPTCGLALAIEHTGDVYACDHYVFPAWRRGTILDEPIETLVESEEQRRFGLDKRDALPRYCRECPVLFACRGECPKTRFAASPDGEPGLNYLCDGYRHFFTHVAPYMEFMKGELAERKPPANVMAWAAERDRRAGVREPGRNDPCPCGSGAKFKRCCGAGL